LKEKLNKLEDLVAQKHHLSGLSLHQISTQQINFQEAKLCAMLTIGNSRCKTSSDLQKNSSTTLKTNSSSMKKTWFKRRVNTKRYKTNTTNYRTNSVSHVTSTNEQHSF